MFLKTLTLRGFKSFASATRMELEPGITCVVGPNGSGKSNVVDALAWVMGEQGAKNLRGSKMEDVIFAGTGKRQPLGRAEVSLTIDNTDGAIPIDYTEVTITRTLFRSGGSEYSINGSPARLLDIQELLNDSGLGKEMHVIVGQGRLDEILHADPFDRRGFIEEAAGVLKHRRRKDKALRKLTGLQANLDRVNDLRAELSDQLEPLGRQAQAAKRAQGVQAVLRDAEARLAADDVVRLSAKLEAGTSPQVAAKAKEELQLELAELDRRISAGTADLAKLETRAEDLTALVRDLDGAAARARALAQRAEDRIGFFDRAPVAPEQGETPEATLAKAKRYAAEQAEAVKLSQKRQAQVDELTAQKDAAQAGLTDTEARLGELRAAQSQLVERRARAENTIESAQNELQRTAADLADLDAQAANLADEHRRAKELADRVRARVADLNDSGTGLSEAAEQTAEDLATARRDLAELDTRVQSAGRLLAAAGARAQALQEGARTPAHLADVLALNVPGVDRALGDLLRIAPGAERAVTAALGSGAQAVLAADLETAAGLLEALDAGTAIEVLIAGPGGPAESTGPAEPAESAEPTDSTVPAPTSARPGPVPALDLVTCSDPAVGRLLETLLADVQVVADAQTALELLAGGAVEADLEQAAERDMRYATLDGELYSATAVSRGVDAEGARLAAAGELERTKADLERKRRALDQLGARREEFSAVVADREAAHRTAQQAEHAAEVRRASAAQELAAATTAASRLDSRRAELDERHSTLTQRRTRAQQDLEDAQRTLEELDAQQAQREADRAAEDSDAGPESAAGETEEERLSAVRDELSAGIAHLGEQLMEARIAVRTAGDRAKFLGDRVAALQRRAEDARAAAQQVAEDAERARVSRERAGRIVTAATGLRDLLAAAQAKAETDLDRAKQSRSALGEDLEELRTTRQSAAERLAKQTQEEAEARLVRERYEAELAELSARVQEETGLSVEHLVERFGPHLPVPVGESTEQPFVRAEVEKSRKAAQRELKAIGEVNPLALEEYAALKERHDFLESQLGDIESTRAELLKLVEQVDEHVKEAFAAAFADTAREFERIFARLFPGGEGSLTLTDPEDLLACGVEVHARPAGKRVKRLSLLSGGERSLVAIALLVAIFKARPSPFYVMDEVEAALDDVNLQRLLTVFEELQESSQLIVITHQNRTMEIADALYGVTMGADGISTVISQRLVKRADDEQRSKSQSV
ncbi:chromosome segregation protein SMC [Brevibacterium moorei]|uniref:chromosome segregation protein SMC n=1 Tax=Brevibacterium moorei TaxID=2968457 RepID=UPI00211CF9B9|nr:chromosome segregation protein SMC [Brevibacterium sp. 68QC2CO]MCQ9384905.1 chromosome segregation protein SMC [Brevibacterium sp. 68QC2CO]